MSDVTLLMSLVFVVSGSGQALAGFVLVRLGTRPVQFAAIALFLLAALVANQVTGNRGLVRVALLSATGNAAFYPADFTLLNQRVSAQRLGHAFSAPGLSG